MNFFVIIFLSMVFSLSAESQLQSASKQKSSPLMMFSFWGNSRQLNDKRSLTDQGKIGSDVLRVPFEATKKDGSTLSQQRDLSLSTRENNTNDGEEGMELVPFVKKNFVGTVASNVLLQQKLQKQFQYRREMALELALQLFMLPLLDGNRVIQPGEDPKLFAVFNKYKNLLFVAYKKNDKQLPLALSYQGIMMDCQRGLDAGKRAADTPIGSFDNNAWSNIVTTTKKLLSFKIPLIAADVVKDSKMSKQLIPRVKEYEYAADLRTQIIHAFEQGKLDVVQRLMASDPSDILQKIGHYESLRKAVRVKNKYLSDAYKKIIKTYQEMLVSRRESACSLTQGAVYPEVSQAWIHVEKSYHMLLDWQTIVPKLAQMPQANLWPFSQHSDAWFKNIEATHKQSIDDRIHAARAAANGHLEEAKRYSEGAAVCERLMSIKNSITNPNWFQLLENFNRIAIVLKKLAKQQAGLNTVLTPEVNGTRSWKFPEAPDFKQRLKAVIPGPLKKVLNGIGGEELQRQLVHDFEVTRKEVVATTNSLGLEDAERPPGLRRQIGELFLQAAKCYSCYGDNKSKFYLAHNDFLYWKWDREYFLKSAESSEKEGDCYMKAIELLRTGDENSQALANRWLMVASLRDSMKLRYDDNIDDCRNLPFLAWQALEIVINLRIQAIEAILRGDPADVIATLDQEAQQREPAAKAMMDQVQNDVTHRHWEWVDAQTRFDPR